MIASGILSLVESRVDRFLLGVGAVVSLSTALLLTTQSRDSEFSNNNPQIGTIKVAPEASQRHSRSLSWKKIGSENKLYLKDMVYVPPKSSAEVILNSNERLTLEPDSMVEFDSISSDRFNIVLMQGSAKLASAQGSTKDLQASKKEIEVLMPEVEKPKLPMFFIDTKSWESNQAELIQSVYDLSRTEKLLTESEIQTKDFVLNSVFDYKLELLPPTTEDIKSSEGPWYRFSWTALPVEGTSYEIEISRNKDFKPAIRHETNQVSLEVQFLEEGTHYWKVIAKNGSDRNASDFEAFIVSPSKQELPKSEGE